MAGARLRRGAMCAVVESAGVRAARIIIIIVVVCVVVVVVVSLLLVFLAFLCVSSLSLYLSLSLDWLAD